MNGPEPASLPAKGSAAETSASEPIRRARIHRSTWLSAILAAILVVLAGILALNGGALPGLSSPASGNPVYVSIDGIDRNITYRGNWTGYFGPTINDTCAFCPMGAQVGSSVFLPMMFLHQPTNLTFTIFYNITGPFLMGAASCSGPNCVIPWVSHFSFFIYSGIPWNNLTILQNFLMPDQPPTGPNIIQFNATICPSPICPPPL